MALDLRFLGSDQAFFIANGGSGDTKIVAEARGGNGLETGGDKEFLIRRGDTFIIPPGQQTDFAYGNELTHPWSLEWDPGALELRYTITRPAGPFAPSDTQTVVFSNPAGFGLDGWAAIFIRLRVPANTSGNAPPLGNGDGGRTARAIMDNMFFEGESFGAYTLQLDTRMLLAGEPEANYIEMVSGLFNNGWLLTGDLWLAWGDPNYNPTPPAFGQTSQTSDNAANNGYPRGSFFGMEFKLSDPPPFTLTNPPNGGGDQDGCFTPTAFLPQTCLVQNKNDCFRYRYACVGGEWVLDYAECVDNSVCSATVIETCDEPTEFIFEARDTCNIADPVPTPVDPRFTNLCFPDC